MGCFDKPIVPSLSPKPEAEPTPETPKVVTSPLDLPPFVPFTPSPSSPSPTFFPAFVDPVDEEDLDDDDDDDDYGDSDDEDEDDEDEDDEDDADVAVTPPPVDPGFEIPLETTAEQFFVGVNLFLAKGLSHYYGVGYKTAGNIISILTALRGPDDSDIQVKRTSTSVIRGAALPAVAKVGLDVVKATPEKVASLKGFGDKGYDSKSLTRFYSHFAGHIRGAGLALSTFSRFRS